MELIKKNRTANNLISSEEAAEILGISPGTLAVWRSVRRYPLPWVKCGRLVRYKIEDIETFIASRTVGGNI